MHLDPRVSVGLPHFDVQHFYLRIVMHRPGVCERVEEAFEGVVRIAPTPVLRIEQGREGQTSLKRPRPREP